MAALIEVTEAAAERIRAIAAREGKTGHSLRLYIAGGGCSGYQYGMGLEDTPREDDLAVHENGVTVLVDPQSARFLKGSMLDYVESLQGSGFKVDNPNSTGSCGCGASHSF